MMEAGGHRHDIMLYTMCNKIQHPPHHHHHHHPHNSNNNHHHHHHSHHSHVEETVTVAPHGTNLPLKVSSPSAVLVFSHRQLLGQVSALAMVAVAMVAVVVVKMNCNPPRQDYYGI
jgi:hypothetical protein